MKKCYIAKVSSCESMALTHKQQQSSARHVTRGSWVVHPAEGELPTVEGWVTVGEEEPNGGGRVLDGG